MLFGSHPWGLSRDRGLPDSATTGCVVLDRLTKNYETHGSGRPMILLNGGLGSGEMFGPSLPALTENRGN